MKHISPIEPAGAAPVKMPKRALGKQQTRVKVLTAARKLFKERGYEGATIRDIAAVAGMSTGAVFANFTEKSDLFHEIMHTDIGELILVMREAADRGLTVEDRLLKMFMAGYGYYMGQLPLARAAFGVSWTADEGQALRAAPVALQHEIISSLLTQAIERGELSQEAEVKLRTQMLFDAYLSNYAQAIFVGWSLEALQIRARDQIRILLVGARRG